MNPLQSLVRSGTKLWLDSIDPELIQRHKQWGASGATSNPIIVADLLKSGRFDDRLHAAIAAGEETHSIAWRLTDELVQQAQEAFRDVWSQTEGDDGYVSFELDALIEDPTTDLPHAERVERYFAEGVRWSAGRPNRMIKIPATPAGLEAVEPLVAAGVPLNVTLIFSLPQYRAAREAAWRGAQALPSLRAFKSVYSIFVSRIDVYTAQHAPRLSPAAQGLVGIVNAKRIWAENRRFWHDRPTPLRQEIVFASTGTKQAGDAPWKYVEPLAGSDIQTNPPATNEAVAASGRTFASRIAELPDEGVLVEIDRTVDFEHMERVLMQEGIDKFAAPQRALLAWIESRRGARAISQEPVKK